MDFTDGFDYYSVLELSPDAPAEDVRRQYRKLALKHHPDKFQDPAEKKIQEETFKKISKAYSVLNDETQRRRYDVYRRSGYSGDFDEEWEEFSFEDALRTFADFVYNFSSPEPEQHNGIIEIPFSMALTGGIVKSDYQRVQVGGILHGKWKPVVEIGQQVYLLKVKFPPTMPREQAQELEKLLVCAQGAAFALKTVLPDLEPYLLGESSSGTSRALFWGASAAMMFAGLALGGAMARNSRR